MLIQQVDGVNLEPLQRSLRHCANVFRPAVQPIRRNRILEAELGRNHHILAERRHRFADNFFVYEWTVRLGRVEEGHAALECRANQRDRLLPLGRWTVTEAQAHAAKANG